MYPRHQKISEDVYAELNGMLAFASMGESIFLVLLSCTDLELRRQHVDDIHCGLPG